MPTTISAHLNVYGRVQGVGYRFFAHRSANRHGLRGWVRNREEGHVEITVEGPRAVIESWLEELRRGPIGARVDRIEVDWGEGPAGFESFDIL